MGSFETTPADLQALLPSASTSPLPLRSYPRGTRYEIVSPTTDGRQAAVICRTKNTGKNSWLMR